MHRRRFLSFAATTVAAPALAQGNPREVTIGAYVIPGSPSEVFFKDYETKITADSKGTLAPNMLIHGEGGAEEQVMSGIRRGRIHVASLSTLVLSSIIPEMALLSAPYLFSTQDEADFVLDKVIIPYANKLTAAKGLVALRWLEIGPQNLYAKKPILTPPDIKNVRVRVSQELAAKMFMEAVGADVIYLPSPDVIPALQTGLITAGVTPTVAYAQTGLTDEAPHYTLLEYTQIGNILVVAKAWLEALPPEQAEVITSSFASNADIRRVQRGIAADAIARQKEYRFTAYTPTPAQQELWRAAASGVTARLIKEVGGGSQALFDAIEAGRKDFAAGR